MKLEVNEDHQWVLCYDRDDGVKNVVFHTFAKKPVAREIEEAVDEMSKLKGFKVEPFLWGPL